MHDKITLDYLNQLFYIDSSNRLRWKVQKGRQPKDSFAGRISTHGYYDVRIDGIARQVHRLMYQMYHSLATVSDLLQVDHIDGDRLNNAKENLRECTRSENQRNRGMQENNKSGFKGVSFDKSRNKWQAGIGVNGKRISLGRFDTPELAYSAYCKKASELHGEFYHS